MAPNMVYGADMTNRTSFERSIAECAVVGRLPTADAFLLLADDADAAYYQRVEDALDLFDEIAGVIEDAISLRGGRGPLAKDLRPLLERLGDLCGEYERPRS